MPDKKVYSHRKIEGELFARVPELKEKFLPVRLEMGLATDRKLTFRQRLQAFLQGRTTAGRQAGLLFDFAAIFLPGRVSTAREAAIVILNRVYSEKYTYNKKTDEIMLKELKPHLQDPRVWGVAAAAGAAVGIFISVEGGVLIATGVFAILAGVRKWREDAKENKNQ